MEPSGQPGGLICGIISNAQTTGVGPLVDLAGMMLHHHSTRWGRSLILSHLRKKLRFLRWLWVTWCLLPPLRGRSLETHCPFCKQNIVPTFDQRNLVSVRLGLTGQWDHPVNSRHSWAGHLMAKLRKNQREFYTTWVAWDPLSAVGDTIEVTDGELLVLRTAAALQRVNQ